MNFGKRVILEIFNNKGETVFSSKGLRVDFDIRLYQGYNRTEFSVYNLNNDTISTISSADPKSPLYARLYVALHDQDYILLADQYYINNVYTEKVVPNSITRMYCIDRLRKEVTSKNIQISVKRPTLRRQLQILGQQAGKGVSITTVDIPAEVLDRLPARPVTKFSGEMEDYMRLLDTQYHLTHTIKPNRNIEFAYKPSREQVKKTSQVTREVLQLQTRDMISNPVIGTNQMEIESVLNSDIVCNSLLDSHNLITASAESDAELYQISNAFLRSVSSDYTIFSVLSVSHSGSTHEPMWTTKALSIKASKGENINKYNWFK